ncbi:glycosyl hydrolase [Acidipila rosea]|uniref:Alpha-L-rhamnosidase-like protein n=1 Tax=Acidipila rosea TaxID=768535 RepID=A0A4R1L629_9BACT|nr:glycosyl hydrolase [Acidipila rosea]TCK71729.1 alpha-L-rhamnosidase-like protein [Acidipila rosea]
MMRRQSTAIMTMLLCFCCTGGVKAHSQSSPDTLKQGFENPPSGARPRVWWHWMNGNITKEGINLDLHWMNSVGIAGFQTFDAALATPQVVPNRLVYMTPEWKDAFRYATTLAGQLKMEEAIAGSPGWSETGGPWVPASQGMKKYVWSETFVEGGKPFSGTLPHPPSNTGAFQDLGIHDALSAPEGSKPIPQFYADAAVIAYRRPSDDVSIASLHPTITSSAGAPDMNVLTDGDLQKTTSLPIPPAGSDAWIQYQFSTPQTIRAVTVAMKSLDRMTAIVSGIGNPEKTVEASDDGQNFRTIATIPDGASPEYTVSFPEVTAKYFRVSFKRNPPPPIPEWAKHMDLKALGIKIGAPPAAYEISELQLYTGARVNRFEEKAAFIPVPDLYGYATPSAPSAAVIQKSDVIDLTSKMRPDGTLDWTPPAGNWVVLRFGYSLLGITNHPATAEATGLEVDKLNRNYVKSYMDNYLDSYKQTVGADSMGKRGIEYVITDSWEAGAQNWTDNMIAEFTKRRGYDPIPWMPVLAGNVVESTAASDRFLWDFRKTIADLTADEHYGQVQASLKERGMGHYGESHEAGRAFIADGMEVKKLDDIPMGAMWTQTPGVNNIQYDYNADDRESASVAHIYGQNIAAAESMTAAAAPWAWSPATLKPTADQELLNGINRFVIHESAHQPLVGKAPGLTLGPFGQWFNRNETWANEAGPWINYLARSSYMLQQGHFDADLVYFYGEDSNLTAIFNKSAPNIPAGYGFDYINADGLIHELSVTDGRITTRSGMSYRVLGLDPFSEHMSLPVLRALHKLVEDGAVVAGPKPIDDPSLADNQSEFHTLNNELFGDGTGVHHVGKGTVYAGQSLQDVFQALKISPDFDYNKPEQDTQILFAHRKLADGDIYFVDNRNDRDETVNASFRVTDKTPELWRAETGKSEPVSYSIADGRTTVPLHLEPWGTVFVVFRQPATTNSRTLPAKTEQVIATLDGPWQLAFQPNRGAPSSITMDQLSSWSDNSNTGVKYFSGTGTYTRTINAPAEWFHKNSRLYIDLGDVKNLADVTVNGKDLGIVWHTPYRVDATGALKPGSNQVTIKVTNAWVNRLIGDQQPNATVKYTFTDVKPYNADSPLLPSGLLGPVRISSVTQQQ